MTCEWLLNDFLYVGEEIASGLCGWRPGSVCNGCSSYTQTGQRRPDQRAAGPGMGFRRWIVCGGALGENEQEKRKKSDKFSFTSAAF